MKLLLSITIIVSVLILSITSIITTNIRSSDNRYSIIKIAENRCYLLNKNTGQVSVLYGLKKSNVELKELD